MKYFFLILLWLSSILMAFHSVSALESASGTSEEVLPELVLLTVIPEDNLHVQVRFSEPVDLLTAKLKLTKQSDNSTLKIASLTGGSQENIIVMNLETELQEGSAYTLTVVSAVGESGSVIRDWALALRDFVTPVPLKQYEIVVNAPPNPNAVIVGSVETGSVVDTTVQNTNSTIASSSGAPASTGANVQIPVSQELPLTGMNPLYFLILVLPIAFFLTKRRGA